MAKFCILNGIEMIPDLLKHHQQDLRFEDILDERAKKLKNLDKPCYLNYRNALSQLDFFQSKHFQSSKGHIEIGDPEELNSTQKELLEKSLKIFRPWKKGPFNIFGQIIDAEWRSDLKWQRIENLQLNLKNKVIADIGCNNGYFMFHMALKDPKLVIGFEPVIKNYLMFKLLNSYAQCPKVQFELLGVEHIDYFPGFFDVIFCMGILYHHTDPIGILRKIHQSLRPKGYTIIDCQGIDHPQAISLSPRKTYAGAKGMWFLPSQLCLVNWLERAGFRSVEVFFSEALSVEEQRTTSWAPIKSLKDFLSSNQKETIEGYPAPWRFYLKASK